MRLTIEHAKGCKATAMPEADRWFSLSVTRSIDQQLWLRCNSPLCEAFARFSEQEVSEMAERWLAAMKQKDKGK